MKELEPGKKETLCLGVSLKVAYMISKESLLLSAVIRPENLRAAKLPSSLHSLRTFCNSALNLKT